MMTSWLLMCPRCMFRELYGRLRMAGAEEWKTPFDNDEFEEFMATRGERR